MGVLLLARDRETGRHAILKMPRLVVARDSATIKRFEHEIETLRHLHHPRVPPWLADGTWLGRRVLAVAHVEGLTASQLIRCRGAVPAAAASPIVADVLGALHAAHTLRADDGAMLHLVHRDVSPQNVIVDAAGRGHLIDFGVSTDARFDGGLDEGHVVGKVGYMAPEVVSGGDIGPAADQFAAGIVLWEMLAARRLFRAASERTTWRNILRCEVPHLEVRGGRAGAAVADIVARMLNVNLTARFPSCGAAAQALLLAAGELGRVRLSDAELTFAAQSKALRGARTVKLGTTAMSNGRAEATTGFLRPEAAASP